MLKIEKKNENLTSVRILEKVYIPLYINMKLHVSWKISIIATTIGKFVTVYFVFVSSKVVTKVD